MSFKCLTSKQLVRVFHPLLGESFKVEVKVTVCD